MKSRSSGKSGDERGNDKRRVTRVEQEVQRSIAQYLVSSFSTPMKGLVTISKVIMPADLRAAKVYVSVIGTEQDREESLEILQERAFEIQKYIGDQLRMRYCPKLKFFNDDTTEHVLKIDRILHDLSKEKSQSSSQEDEDSE